MKPQKCECIGSSTNLVFGLLPKLLLSGELYLVNKITDTVEYSRSNLDFIYC